MGHDNSSLDDVDLIDVDDDCSSDAQNDILRSNNNRYTVRLVC